MRSVSPCWPEAAVLADIDRAAQAISVWGHSAFEGVCSSAISDRKRRSVDTAMLLNVGCFTLVGRGGWRGRLLQEVGLVVSLNGSRAGERRADGRRRIEPRPE